MHKEIWEQCMQIFRDNLEGTTYKTFFEPIIPISVKQNVLTIQVPTQFYYEYLEEHYIDLLRKAIRRFLGPNARLEYCTSVGRAENSITIPSRTSRGHIVNPAHSVAKVTHPGPYVAAALTHVQIDPHLTPDFTFENFVEGECNRLARAAGWAIAEKPGVSPFNPFFIYGGSGLGKTHLAQAIGIRVKELMPQKNVLYVNATMIGAQLRDSTVNNAINDFLNFYQCLDVLIVDDVQQFTSMKGTQKQFFEIFNHLHLNNKQLILTSDRAPVDLNGLIDERLLSRFKWGLSTELFTPDYTTRLAILRKRAYRDGISFPDEVLEYVAKHVVENVRELEGALNGLLAQATLTKKKITLELAQAAIDKIATRKCVKDVSVDYILQRVSDHYQMDKDTILSKTRRREVVVARQMAIYLSKKYTKTSLKSIGAQIGGKDHATVLHAIKSVENLRETDRSFNRQIEELEAEMS